MFEVGDEVVLADDFAAHADAAHGPLNLGDVGSVVRVNGRQSVDVRAQSGREWNYNNAALRKAAAPIEPAFLEGAAAEEWCRCLPSLPVRPVRLIDPSKERVGMCSDCAASPCVFRSPPSDKIAASTTLQSSARTFTSLPTSTTHPRDGMGVPFGASFGRAPEPAPEPISPPVRWLRRLALGQGAAAATTLPVHQGPASVTDLLGTLATSRPFPVVPNEVRFKKGERKRTEPALFHRCVVK